MHTLWRQIILLLLLWARQIMLLLCARQFRCLVTLDSGKSVPRGWCSDAAAFNANRRQVVRDAPQDVVQQRGGRARVLGSVCNGTRHTWW